MLRSTTYFACAAALMFLAGCGPMYETRYNFLPPESASGRACIFQCDNGKMQCEQIEDMQKERCEDRADRDYDRCRDRGEKYCYRESCSADYTRCEDRYRSCYSSCGGKVEKYEMCVSFCEGAPARR